MNLSAGDKKFFFLFTLQQQQQPKISLYPSHFPVCHAVEKSFDNLINFYCFISLIPFTLLVPLLLLLHRLFIFLFHSCFHHHSSWLKNFFLSFSLSFTHSLFYCYVVFPSISLCLFFYFNSTRLLLTLPFFSHSSTSFLLFCDSFCLTLSCYESINRLRRKNCLTWNLLLKLFFFFFKVLQFIKKFSL